MANALKIHFFTPFLTWITWLPEKEEQHNFEILSQRQVGQGSGQLWRCTRPPPTSLRWRTSRWTTLWRSPLPPPIGAPGRPEGRLTGELSKISLVLVFAPVPLYHVNASFHRSEYWIKLLLAEKRESSSDNSWWRHSESESLGGGERKDYHTLGTAGRS